MNETHHPTAVTVRALLAHFHDILTQARRTGEPVIIALRRRTPVGALLDYMTWQAHVAALAAARDEVASLTEQLVAAQTQVAELADALDAEQSARAELADALDAERQARVAKPGWTRQEPAVTGWATTELPVGWTRVGSG